MRSFSIFAVMFFVVTTATTQAQWAQSGPSSQVFGGDRCRITVQNSNIVILDAHTYIPGWEGGLTHEIWLAPDKNNHMVPIYPQKWIPDSGRDQSKMINGIGPDIFSEQCFGVMKYLSVYYLEALHGWRGLPTSSTASIKTK